MTNKKILIIATIWIIALIWLFFVATKQTANAVNPNSEKIADLTFQLSELQFKKLNCLDNLSRKESEQQIKWTALHCIEYDEQMMMIQAEIDSLSAFKSDVDESENCIWWIWCTKEERTPWMLNESWDAQQMPNVEWNNSHEKFKNLATSYWLDAWMIREVENHYWIKEWVVLCITVAETSWWNRWYWWKNIWSVWSNDRWDRPTFALMESWLEAIWKTLTNQYLWNKKTLWCLSNAWSCAEQNDNWKRYATSTSSREKNMTACLSTIYWTINPSDFSIRR